MTQAYGTYQHLIESGIDFTQLLHKKDEEIDEASERAMSEKQNVDEDIILLKKQVR